MWSEITEKSFELFDRGFKVFILSLNRFKLGIHEILFSFDFDADKDLICSRSQEISR